MSQNNLAVSVVDTADINRIVAKHKHTAANCNHYGMCKLDFLGIGVCPSGRKSGFVAYYPQGRMEIVNALAENVIPVTQGLVRIANECNLCGICDKQCNYITKHRILPVMKSLKDYVRAYLDDGNKIIDIQSDNFLKGLQEIVGSEWASNDPAVLASYSRDKGLGDRHMPKYVVMVGSEIETSLVIMLARQNRVPYTLRSNGGNGWSATLGKGLIIDFHRMNKIEIDAVNRTATIEPGVQAFNLQKEAEKHGLRACVGEATAGICANIFDTEINSLFSQSYGMGTDLIVNANFTAPNGQIITKDVEDIKFFNHKRLESADAITKMKIQLFPKLEEEEMFVLPFYDFNEAIEMSRELARNKIGFVNGVVSSQILAFCLTLTVQAEEELLDVLKNKLEVKYVIIACADKEKKELLKKLTDVYINQELFEIVMKSVSKLSGNEGVDLLTSIPTQGRPYEALFKEQMNNLADMVLSPAREDIVEHVDDDLKKFYKNLFSDPNYLNGVYLNVYRINTPRIARRYRFFPFLMRISLADIPKIEEIINNLKSIGQNHNLLAEFGNLNPSKLGEWAMIEFDFFFNNDDDRERVVAAFNDASKMLHDYKNNKKAVIDSFYPKGFVYRDSFYSYQE